MSTVTHTIEDTDDPELLGRVIEDEKVELVGLLAEYESVDEILKAARAVRRAGFTRWDVHSPFPIHGIDYAMGIKPTIIDILMLIGSFGLFFTLFLLFCRFLPVVAMAEVKTVMPQSHAHPEEHDEMSGDEFKSDYRPDEHHRPKETH